MRRSLLLIVLLCAPISLLSQESDDSQNPNTYVEGYVTHTFSATQFAVDGQRVSCNAKTVFKISGTKQKKTKTLPWRDGPYLGEKLSIVGKQDYALQQVIASKVTVTDELPDDVSGYGVIVRVQKPWDSTTRQGLYWADGYPISIDAKTTVKLDPQIKDMAEVGTNYVIAFKGRQELNGIVTASLVAVEMNSVGETEAKLRKKYGYDPEAVDPRVHQSGASKFFKGLIPKEIPPYSDAKMQARIEKIGKSVVPKYQFALAESDPTRIDFRFELVDERKWFGCWALPSGVILVPRQVVEYLPNDSQLAAVLAGSVASVLAGQSAEVVRANKKLLAVELAGATAGWFVPGLGLAEAVGQMSAASVIDRRIAEQMGRISLVLLADGGYDLRQAPVAWSLLAAKRSDTVSEVPIDNFSKYLYRTLGRTWRNWSAPEDSGEPGASNPAL